MKQHIIITTEDELINWLNLDLQKQRLKIAERDEISISNVDNKDLILNLGCEEQSMEINFAVKFDYILEKIDNKFSTGSLGSEKPRFSNICYKIIFNSVVFNESLEIIGIDFLNDVSIYNTNIKNEFILDSCIFKNMVHFGSIIFEKKVYIGKTLFEKEFRISLSKFCMELEIYDNSFKSKVDFSTNEIKFNCLFYNTKFYDAVTFSFITIKRRLEFVKVIFEKNANIYYNMINPDHTIKDALVETKSEISMTGIIINKHIDFNSVSINKINLKNSIILDNGSIDRLRLEVACSNWETATILKHEELKRDNIIGALCYKAIEKDMYTKELFLKIIETLKNALYTTNIIIFFKNLIKLPYAFFEWFALFLSKISNNHGQSWLQAIIFTGVTGLFFFILSYMPESINIFSLDMHENNDVFYKLGRFFLPVDYSGITNKRYLVKPSSLTFYFIGKAAISYGYVEIVQAFRKLK